MFIKQTKLSTVSGITIVVIYFVKILLGPHFSFSGFCLFVRYNKTITTILTSGHQQLLSRGGICPYIFIDVHSPGMFRDRAMVLNATFSNISAISWRSHFIGGENRRTQRKPDHIQLYYIHTSSAIVFSELKI
jgi:hypothetical protein